MFSPLRLLLGAAASFVLLAGCSAPTVQPTTSAPETPAASAPAEQSVLGACAALGSTMDEAASKMQSAMSEFTSDPDKAVKALKEFQDSFADAVAKVSNPTVKAQAEKALAATKEMVSTLEAGIKNPAKLANIEKVVNDFQTEMTAIGGVCGG